jgi:hypothetical protein
LKAFVLDDLIDEFAPAGRAPGDSGSFWIGRRDVEVARFYVAWSPGQLEGIVAKAEGTAGTYVAYLGAVDEKMRALLSGSLSAVPGLLIRFVGHSWRYHSWGVAGVIARALAVEDAVPVRVLGKEADHKVMTFLPAGDVGKVRESLFASGAGKYGLYSKCSFATSGRGTFYGEKGSRPAVGQAGKLEEIDEEKLEVRVPREKLARVLSALRKAHPYEEPVIEIYETNTGTEYGEGRTGRLGTPVAAQGASRKIASVLGSQPVLSSGREQYEGVLVWDGVPSEGLYELSVSGAGLYIGPDSRGLGKVMALTSPFGIVEFPRYCFLLAGAKELVYMVRETSKREGWGVKTYLPTRSGGEGVPR